MLVLVKVSKMFWSDPCNFNTLKCKISYLQTNLGSGQEKIAIEHIAIVSLILLVSFMLGTTIFILERLQNNDNPNKPQTNYIWVQTIVNEGYSL